MKRQLGIELDDFPESMKKRALKGEPIGIPGTATMEQYVNQFMDEDPAHGAAVMREFMKAFKQAYDHLECYEKGVARGERAMQELGKKISRSIHRRKTTGQPMPSCQANCPACCHIHVTLTDSEAEVLVKYLRERGIKLDRDLVEYQAKNGVTDSDHVEMPYEKRACPILGKDGNCRAYDARPLVCRKFMVASPPWMCDMRRSSQSAIIMDPATEGFVSAQMALEQPEKPSDDNLPNQLLKRISADDRIWKHLRSLEK